MTQNIQRKKVKHETFYMVDDKIIAAIDTDGMLLVATSSVVERGERRMLDRLAVKAKARDGVKGIQELPGHVMQLQNGEVVITRP